MRNVPNGFWVCQDDEAAADEAIVGRLRLADLEGVVLASDGAVRGNHLLGLHGADSLVTRMVDHEHADVFTEIRQAEASRRDELVARCVKVHDDMTVVSFRIPDRIGER
jgi:hypothetical protein